MAANNNLRQDPAMLKYYNMTMNRARYFRWTGRTARIAFIYAAVVPSFFIWLGNKYDGKWDMRAKLRGNTVSEY